MLESDAGYRRYVSSLTHTIHVSLTLPTAVHPISFPSLQLWDSASPGQPLLRSWDHHSEFAVGLDFSMLREGLIASAGWDESVWVWSQADPVAAP